MSDFKQKSGKPPMFSPILTLQDSETKKQFQAMPLTNPPRKNCYRRPSKLRRQEQKGKAVKQ
jgi:hypothetical protein